MTSLVGCSCDPLTIYLPQVGVRGATVSRVTHLRCRCARVSVGLRFLDTQDIGGVGASGSRGSDRLSHVGNRCPSSSVSHSYMISTKEYGLGAHSLLRCGGSYIILSKWRSLSSLSGSYRYRGCTAWSVSLIRKIPFWAGNSVGSSSGTRSWYHSSCILVASLMLSNSAPRGLRWGVDLCSYSNLSLGSSWLYPWYSSSLRRLNIYRYIGQ